jgi:hypothetical protein
MKKIIVFSILLCWNHVAFSQVYSSYKNLDQEKIYVHQNTNLLFVGEYLYYKVYCINATNNKPSNNSKIAYIELIGENNLRVFKQKVQLENGLGQGDFFLQTSIPTGNYKLIVYTQWMRNNNILQFYEGEINIINPYLSNQGEAVTKSISNNSSSLKVTDANKNLDTHNKTKKYQRLILNSDKEEYHKREKVSLKLLNSKDKLGFGNFSVSVRKIDGINITPNYTASDFIDEYSNQEISKRTDKDEFLPEIKGELISGRLINKETQLPANNVNVTLSIPGETFLFKIVRTDKDGFFHVFLHEEFDGDQALIQIVGEDTDIFDLTINNPGPIDLNELKFNSFKIDSSFKDIIVERSIQNQIENSYYSVKPDSIYTPYKKEPFYSNKYSTVYNLDEYSKFPTIREVFIEIVDLVYKKRIDNKTVFYIKHREDYSNLEGLPLVIMDGILVQDYEALLNYEAKKVKRVVVLKNKVYYGATTYNGVIAIETLKNTFKDDINQEGVTYVKLNKPIVKKKYYKQQYFENTVNEASRIPDYRNQLLWLPEINLESGNYNISFFTSDIAGDYEICLEGFTNYGEAISLIKKITVKY